MRKLGVGLALSLLAACSVGAASASTPGTNGAILFTQPRCPSWAGSACHALPQPCAVDPVTGASFVPALPLGAVLSPDGRRIAWTAVRGTSKQLLVANADGSGEQAVAPADPVGSAPAWSPDGSKLAFEGASDTNPSPLEVANLATGELRRLASGVFDQSWAPDGSEIAVQAFDANVRPVIGAVDPAKGSLRLVTSEPNTADQPADSAPDWSPDSSQLVFTRRAFNVPPEVQAVASDGSGRRDVTQGELASWAPDGARIVFVRDGGVWTSAPDGSGGSRIASVPGIAATLPRWLTSAQSSALTSIGNCDTDAQSDATYVGGEGRDTFVVTGVRLAVYGNGGDDLFVVGHATERGSTLLDGSAGNDDFELFGSANNVTAGDGNDRVDALLDGRPQNVSGGAGNDWARGGAGNDRIDGGPGNDSLFGGGGANTIYGGSANDTVSASVSSSPQHLFGGPGNDRVVGGRGPDAIFGGTGRDRVVAGAGGDVVHAQDRARDVVDCGAGRDTVYADRVDAVSRNCERVLRR